jgi:hypothetical protein
VRSRHIPAGSEVNVGSLEPRLTDVRTGPDYGVRRP